MRTRWKMGGICAVMVLILGCGGSEADPASPENGPVSSPPTKSMAEAPAGLDGIPENERQAMLAQIPLQDAAHQLRWAVEAGDNAGYTGIELADGKVVLWWKGELPASMRATVAQAGNIAPVEVRSSAHTRAELDAVATMLRSMLKTETYRVFHSFGLSVDGSGITLRTDAPPGTLMPSLPDMSVPVQVMNAPPVKPTSRVDDSPQYWGGAVIRGTDVRAGKIAVCTSGFGVIHRGARYLLTAGHCGRVGEDWKNGNGSRTIGRAVVENPGLDLLLIAADAGNRIYDGGATTNVFSKGVATWDAVTPGESLCTSGSTTGAICGWKVSRTFPVSYCDTDFYGNRECYGDMFGADHSSRDIKKGDSGGPVFSLASKNRVTAKGIISGAATRFLIFQDFYSAAAHMGVDVLTSSN